MISARHAGVSLIVLAGAVAGAVLLRGTPVPPGRVDAAIEGAEHEGSSGHEEGFAAMDPGKMEGLGLGLHTVGATTIRTGIDLPGEIRANENRLAHVRAPLPGVVRSVRKEVGQAVKAGEEMAELECRDLAEARAARLAARSRLGLAEGTFERERRLWKEEIASEKEYRAAESALEEARIGLNVAEQRLRALGHIEEVRIPEGEASRLRDLGSRPEDPSGRALARYVVRSPLSGTVIERRIVPGETVTTDARVFVVADLDPVWVDLAVYARDQHFIRKGSEAVVSAGEEGPRAVGVVSFVGPTVNEKTRTVIARVVLPNPDGAWRPGTLVQARVTTEATEVPVAVPRSAVQTVQGRPSVFVREEGGFRVRPVETGRMDEISVEIRGGVGAGEEVATGRTLYLKSEVMREELGGHED